MYRRGNEVQRNRRRRAQQRSATCQRCGAQWTHLKGGQLPALCPGCAEEHGYCARCQTVRTRDLFHRDGRGGWNRTCAACHAIYMRGPRVKEQQRWSKILRTYGLSRDDFTAMVAGQDGLCALCERPPKEFVVDHCHRTGKVRALLCRPCNTSIGAFGDDPARLRRALDYLLAYGG